MGRRKSIKSRALAVIVSITMVITMMPAVFMMNMSVASAESAESIDDTASAESAKEASADTATEASVESSNNTETGKITYDVLGYVYFGSYPQREVVSKRSDSGVYGKTWETKNDYIIDSELYTQLKNANNWNSNNDVEITDSESGKKTKYHRMNKSGALRAVSDYNQFYGWSDDTTYHYFKYEPIKWRVLEKDGNNAFLLAETALDNQPYNGNNYAKTWETCSMRNWLNSTFMNRAFTADEQNAINLTDVKNENNLYYGTNGGKNTKDKVFLLSESELCTENAVKYGFDRYAFTLDKARQAKSSTYAKARGVRLFDGAGYSYCGICNWWLRSPGIDGSSAAIVIYSGKIHEIGATIDNMYNACRPALYLNMKSTDLYTTEDRKVEKTSEDVKLSSSSFEYDGTEKEPEVTIKDLSEGTDYSVEYSDNKNPGTAKVIIKGIGKCTGTIEKTFTIAMKIPEQTGQLTWDINYDLVEFGSYPQTEIVSQASDSGVYGKAWAKKNDYIADANLYAQLKNAKNWDTNDDVEITDAESGKTTKYHRLKKSGATYSTSKDSRYYNWSDSDTYHYFKYEPIKWRVLEKDGDNAFLLAETVLDDQKYNTSSSSVTWETCSLRSWLNGYGSSYNKSRTDYTTNNFIDRAFTADEQKAINLTDIENKNNLQYGTNGGNDTKDKVFLLSKSEVCTDNAIKYGFDSSRDSYDKARQAKGSTYAKARGVYTYSSNNYLGNCYWWLRSPGKGTNSAAYGIGDGQVDEDGDFVYQNYLGCRPALHLNLKSANPASAGNTGVIKTKNTSNINIPKDIFVYRDKAVTPKVSIPELTEGKDYDVKYSNNDKLGIATITVTSKGNWTGTITRHFAIVEEMDISDMTMTLTAEKYYYEGSPVCPKVVIAGLEENTDFSVSYEDNDNVGTGKITVTGIDGYKGQITKTFAINDHKDHFDAVSANAATCTKAGNTEYWHCSGCDKYYSDADGDNEIAKGSWVLKASGHRYTSVNAGNGCTHKKCEKCGSTTSYASPVYVKSFKLVKGKKGMTVKWKKQSKAVQKKFTGYRIRYSLKSNMSGAKTVTVSKAASSKKISKLSAKKTYYVEICSFVKRGGKVYYSKVTKKAVKTR